MEARVSTDRIAQFPLRLPKSLREAAKQMAASEGVSLNYFISRALAEKISRVVQQAVPSSQSKINVQSDIT